MRGAPYEKQRRLSSSVLNTGHSCLGQILAAIMWSCTATAVVKWQYHHLIIDESYVVYDLLPADILTCLQYQLRRHIDHFDIFTVSGEIGVCNAYCLKLCPNVFICINRLAHMKY